MKLSTVLRRAVRLRCPICGRGKLFAGWFKMHESCADCGEVFQREPGFFLGSIYVNYGLTAMSIVGATVGSLLFTGNLPSEAMMAGMLAFVVLFPLWFFRYARSLWLAFDCYFDSDKPSRKPIPPKSE